MILHQVIAEMLIYCLPISVVERLGFRSLLHLPILIPNMQTQVMTCVAKRLELLSHISFSIDLWSSFSLDAYLSLTGHRINDNWVVNRRVFACVNRRTNWEYCYEMFRYNNKATFGF